MKRTILLRIVIVVLTMALGTSTVSAQKFLNKVKKAAEDGAENTKNMEAVRGRATYQADKGIGHLDPGAVTMSYQIEVLMDFVKEKIR